MHGTSVTTSFDDEQLALLDALCAVTKKRRATLMRDLVVAVLEDDAATHQGVTSSPDKVIYLRNWMGAR